MEAQSLIISLSSSIERTVFWIGESTLEIDNLVSMIVGENVHSFLHKRIPTIQRSIPAAPRGAALFTLKAHRARQAVLEFGAAHINTVSRIGAARKTRRRSIRHAACEESHADDDTLPPSCVTVPPHPLYWDLEAGEMATPLLGSSAEEGENPPHSYEACTSSRNLALRRKLPAEASLSRLLSKRSRSAKKRRDNSTNVGKQRFFSVSSWEHPLYTRVRCALFFMFLAGIITTVGLINLLL